MTLQLPQHTPARVGAPDGVAVAVQDWGAPFKEGRGPDVIFLHGFSQAHPCWLRQVSSPLAQQFRLVTYDLRGHGASDKPQEAFYYQHSKRWADELQAVIEQLELERPIVVAWSYAGRIALDYLSVHGAAHLGGLVMVNATSSTNAVVMGPDASLLAQMCDPDPAINVPATRALLNACVAKPLPADVFEFMLAYNLLVPPAIRANLRRAPGDYHAVLQALRLPTLVVHGALDTINLPAMAEYTASEVAGAQLRIYEDVAHMAFWEAPERFNADLADFVRACRRA